MCAAKMNIKKLTLVTSLGLLSVLLFSLYVFKHPDSRVTRFLPERVKNHIAGTGSKPLLFVQAYVPARNSCIVTGDGADEFTACARSLFLGNNPGADNSGQAALMLRQCLGAGGSFSSRNDSAILIGHGVPGLIRTGGDGNVDPLPGQK